MLRSLRLQIWIAKRHLSTGGRFLNITTSLAFVGMVVGVSCLVLAMSVISGFESTLKKSVIDFSGDIMLLRTGEVLEPLETLLPKIKAVTNTMTAYTPFVQTEGLLAREGRTTGVMLQGFESESMSRVLNLQSKIIEGSLDLSSLSGSPAVVGKALSKKFKLHVGDEFQVIIPRPSLQNPGGFSPKSQKLKVVGIVDLGKYEYDVRYIITQADIVQKLLGRESGYTGLLIKLTKDDLAPLVSQKLGSELGYPYWTRSWLDINHNLFEAIKIEKVVIFVVLLFMVLTASFNICSTLFVSVLTRYQEISILKTMGMTKKFLMGLFSLHGLLMGALGSVSGVLLGIILSYSLVNSTLFQIPAEVYKLDHLPVEIRFWDICAILGASLIICFLSSLMPAIRGANLNTVDGLRYE